VRAPRQKGFTLIEVLVAFTILVASVGVVVVIFGNGLRVSGMADDYVKAISVAENQMAELRVADTLLPGETGGVTGKDMAWKVRIAPGFLSAGGNGAEGKPDFLHIAVTVAWGEAGDEPRTLTLHTLRASRQARQSGQDEDADGEADDAADGADTAAEDGGNDGTDEADEE
jgi:general secretion pathway protein I